MRILYVDDELAMRDVTARLLGKENIAVETAANGPAAIARVRQGSPALDVVVTDLSMPEMNGVDLARALRAIAPDLPIIAFSGSPPPHLQNALHSELFAAVVRKGDNPLLLRDAILRVAAAHRCRFNTWVTYLVQDMGNAYEEYRRLTKGDRRCPGRPQISWI